MGRGKKYQPEQVVNLLRRIEMAKANGKTTALASNEVGIVERAIQLEETYDTGWPIHIDGRDESIGKIHV